MPLSDVIAANPCLPTLKTGWVNLPELHALVHRVEQAAYPLDDEQALTYLFAYGFAIHPGGAAQLARILTEDDTIDGPDALWFEFLPRSPRIKEGETHLDLAVGDVKRRDGTLSGIEFDRPAGRAGWVGMVEVKLRSDLSSHVKYDPLRNQLLRVIENALVFEAHGQIPSTVHVTLVSPKVFREHWVTRYYGYKFHEYRTQRAKILEDLDRLTLRPAQQIDLGPRVTPEVLKLHWISIEEIITAMPESEFKAALVDLLRRPGGLVQLTV